VVAPFRSRATRCRIHAHSHPERHITDINRLRYKSHFFVHLFHLHGQRQLRELCHDARPVLDLADVKVPCRPLAHR
jgi:hypothetical protein